MLNINGFKGYHYPDVFTNRTKGFLNVQKGVKQSKLIMWIITDSKQALWIAGLQKVKPFYKILFLSNEQSIQRKIKEQSKSLKLPGIILIDCEAAVNIVELVAQLKPEYPETPIFAVTACPDWREARTLFHAGINDYISKGASQEELVGVLLRTRSEGSNSTDIMVNQSTNHRSSFRKALPFLKDLHK